MRSLLLVVVVFGVAYSQETEAPPDGQPYGALCNGLLLQCNRYSNTVACMARNSTAGVDHCSTGIGVDLGRCQCTRNCPADNIFNENGEFDQERQLCVGFVGQLCTSLVPHCTSHATCNFLTSKCACQIGYHPDAEGLRCIPN